MRHQEKAWVKLDTYHAEGYESMVARCGVRMGGLDRLMLRSLAERRAEPCAECYHRQPELSRR